MRILVDYRAALRARTGVGEYIRELVRAYTARHPDPVTLFTSSWKDRPSSALGSELRASVIDRRVPVRVLNLLWHRAEWPPVEMLAGAADVAHAAHPLLIPARRAAQVVTIHDLFFLQHPERTHAEIRRDYPALAGAHARRAHAVITSTAHTKGLLEQHLGVRAERIYICPPGPPVWRTHGHSPNVPPGGYILFVGTLEPRKNIGRLLDAYAMLVERIPDAPALVLAGRATPDAEPWLARLNEPPFKGRVRHLGYVPDEDHESLYAGARVVTLPSLDEGFGLPVLAAMSAGVPVVATRRGALPEVAGDAGLLVDPEDARDIAEALIRVVTDSTMAHTLGEAGLCRSRAFSWDAAAQILHRAYVEAVERRRTQDRR